LVVIRGHHSGRLSSNGPLGLLGWQFARRIASSARPRRGKEECRREEDGALRGTIFGTYPPVTAPETLCAPETPQPLSWRAMLSSSPHKSYDRIGITDRLMSSRP
jgi:hypothetical protein